MKVSKWMVAVLAAAATTVSVAQQDPARPKTRAEVRAEVEKARVDGTLDQFNGEGAAQYRRRPDGSVKTNDELRAGSRHPVKEVAGTPPR